MLKRHFTVGNVTLLVVVFMALSAGSYAAIRLPANSVGTRQLKAHAVTAPKLATGSVTGAKVADGSLTGADVDVTTLGKVPSATAADTAGSAAITHVHTVTATGTSRDGSISSTSVPIDGATATCDNGLVVVGGGVRLGNPVNQAVLQDYPAGANAWTGEVVNGGAGTPGFTVYAICASAAGN
jgi:type IV secretory pathway TrbL component